MDRVLRAKRPRSSGTALHALLDRAFPYLCLIPSSLVLLGIIGYTMVQTVLFSFQDLRLGEMRGIFVGLENYRYMLGERNFFPVIGQTLYFTFGTLTLEFAAALPLALVLFRPFPGAGLLRGLLLVPFLFATVVTASVWKWALNDVAGVVNWILMDLGVIDQKIAWLATHGVAMHVLIFVSAWSRFAVVTLVLVGGLQSIPGELWESAAVEGASGWQTFRFVTLPLLMPFVLLALALRTTFAMREFDLVWLITAGGPAGSTELLSTYTYKWGFTTQDAGLASALSVVLLILTVGVTMIYLRYIERARNPA